jgi:hypothetical protein
MTNLNSWRKCETVHTLHRQTEIRSVWNSWSECLFPRGIIMKKLFLIATAIAAIGGATTDRAGACTLHFPTFELTGFPISSHQVGLLGGAHVEERSATPTLMLAGMPASPHQIAVLTPRWKAAKIVQASAGPSPITVGLGSRVPGNLVAAGQTICAPD